MTMTANTWGVECPLCHRHVVTTEAPCECGFRFPRGYVTEGSFTCHACGARIYWEGTFPEDCLACGAATVRCAR